MGMTLTIDLPPEMVTKLQLLAQRLGYAGRENPDQAEGSIAWLLRVICEDELIILPKSVIALWSANEQMSRNAIALDKIKEAIRILGGSYED
ncbi:MAG: hypothetical protein ACYC6L_14025 [Anaerolineae bacterium]